MTKTQFDNILRYACIFAEDTRIIEMSPDYIIEKFERYIGDPDMVNKDKQKGLNIVLEKRLMEKYYKKWGKIYDEEIGSPHTAGEFVID